MPELIDKRKLLNTLCKECSHCKNMEEAEPGSAKPCSVHRIISEQPTIEAEPVRHGRWIKQENGLNLCSVCGVTKVSHLPFCGHCGARMDATDTNVGGKGGDDEMKLCCCISDKEAKMILGGADNG